MMLPGVVLTIAGNALILVSVNAYRNPQDFRRRSRDGRVAWPWLDDPTYNELMRYVMAPFFMLGAGLTIAAGVWHLMA